MTPTTEYVARLLVISVALSVGFAQNATESSAVRNVKKRDQFRVIYEWNTLDYAWPSDQAKQNAINESKYIPTSVVISGIAYYDGKFYLTVPRMLEGVPATLATIPASSSETNPVLTPFPSWEANMVGDCNAFQFVQNVEVDKNGMLWIIDNGRVNTMTSAPDTKCPPTLVTVDLKGGKNTMVRYTFPTTVVSPNSSYLNDLVIDNRDGDYAYITDNSAADPGIVVFRRSDGHSWKLRDGISMTAVQFASNFYLNGTTINLPVNIDGIALGPPSRNENGAVDRIVYYCPLASYHLYSINASVLRNESLASLGAEAIRQYVSDVGVKASQTDGMKMDDTGVLFYGLIGNYTIAEWDSNTDFATNQKTIARDPNYIQWVDRFTFDDTGNIYVVVNRLYNYVAFKVKTDEVNYRILKSFTGTKNYVFAEAENKTEEPKSSAGSLQVTLASVILVALSVFLR